MVCQCLGCANVHQSTGPLTSLADENRIDQQINKEKGSKFYIINRDFILRLEANNTKYFVVSNARYTLFLEHQN